MSKYFVPYKKHQATKITIDGITYDSNMEYQFHLRYKDKCNHNTTEYVVWKGSRTLGEITYTPDFISTKDDKKVWIEIKPTVQDDLYKLREKLIKEYCSQNFITFMVIVYDKVNDKFIEISKYKQQQQQKINDKQNILKRIWYLYYERASITEEEYQELFNLLKDNTKWNRLHKGKMQDKQKTISKVREYVFSTNVRLGETQESTTWTQRAMLKLKQSKEQLKKD